MLNNYEELDLSILNLSEDEQKIKPHIIKSEDNIVALKKFETIEDFMSKWKDVQNFVAGHIQADLEQFKLSEDFVWNIYLLYIIPKNLEIEEYFINDIESNKFCCKKYVLRVDDINDKENIGNVMLKKIPLFSDFNFSTPEAISSDESLIKNSIFIYTNKQILANKFLFNDEIKNKVEETEIKDFINRLKEEYQNENRTDSI